jgi:hypothetical protein
MEPENASEPMQETEAIQPKNIFSRLGGVYLTPKNAFQEIGGSPRVLIPIIITIVLGILLGVYLIKTVDLSSSMMAQLEKAVDKGQMPKEQMERAMPIMEKIAPIQLLAVTTLGFVINALIVAGFAKLVSVIVGAKNKFRALFSVSLFAVMAIFIVQSILLILVLRLKGSADFNIQNPFSMIASNLGAVIESVFNEDALPKFVMGLAKAVDVFAIWMIALLSIGFSTVSQKLKVSTIATWFIAAYAIVAIIGALLARS